MPTYSYICDNCNNHFELFATFSNYKERTACPQCSSKKTHRDYVLDASTINASVKKSDSELKTLGDLANRNRDKLSDDEKVSLYKKHNSYREDLSENPLPKGMSRMKKTQPVNWTPKGKIKRKRKKND